VSPTRATLLYIEDNPSNIQLIKRIFRDRHEIDVRIAERGQEGIDLARAERPALILLDLHLPDMPGIEVLQALRADPATAAIPVVVVSADATGDQIAEVRASGVADYVTKPFEVPSLLALVDRLLAPVRAAAPTLESSGAN
jgi:CheY-like chemotaxis protein